MATFPWPALLGAGFGMPESVPMSQPGLDDITMLHYLPAVINDLLPA